jgi:ribonuclease HII
MEFPTYEIEDEIKAKGFKYIAGVDEVARGTLVGSVVAAAVIIPDNFIMKLMYKVNDSKKLSPGKREELYDLIIDNCKCGIGIISNETIDEINILEATKLAMYSALTQLGIIDYALIDGNVVVDNLSVPQQQIIKGDNKSISIASASIIAKVTKDRIMDQLHEEYPQYAWNTNRGYGTKRHTDAIKRYGITKYHRKSFGICQKHFEINVCTDLLENCRFCKNNKADVGEKIICYRTDYPEAYRNFLEGANKDRFKRIVGTFPFPPFPCEFYEKLEK